ncbi:hypothetical protein ACNKHQ_14780 [Shigella flexneri]
MNDEGITRHLTGRDDPCLIQRAARKIDGMASSTLSRAVKAGKSTSLLAFWAGYKGPKALVRLNGLSWTMRSARNWTTV